jgi:hypothetical protein
MSLQITERSPKARVRDTRWRVANLTATTAAPAAASEPRSYISAAVVGSGEHIFFVGPDGHMHELAADVDCVFKHSAVSQPIGAPRAQGNLAAYHFFADRTHHLFYRGLDSQIHELFRHDGDPLWRHSPIGAASGAPPALGDPHAYVFRSEQSQHVVYVGRDDRHVHELFWMAGQGWQHSDLTVAANAPLADALGAAYELDFEQTQHVIFLEGTSIHELFWSRHGGWQHAPLSQLTFAYPASDLPCAYAYELGQTQRIVYPGPAPGGSGFNLYSLVWRPDQGWQSETLTDGSPVPRIDGRPFGYGCNSTQQERVFFRSNDRLFELSSERSGPWTFLGAIAGLPPAASNVAGYVVENAEGWQYLVYRGKDNAVHRLIDHDEVCANPA